MKKLNLKTLLMAGALLMGSNAWAGDTTTTYDFEDGNAVFTGQSRVTVAIENNATLSSNVVGFTCAGNAQNGYSFANYDMTSLTSTAQIVTINFDYYNTNGGRCLLTIGDASMRGNTGGSSKTTYNSTGGIFRIGSDKNYFYVNGTRLSLSTYCNKWLNVNVVVNVITKKVSYSVKEGETVLQSGTDVAFYSDGTACTQIDLFGYINNSNMAKIDNLSITSSVNDAATYADYTVSFYDQTAAREIKSDTRNGQVGAVISLTSDDISDFKNDGNTIKYIYVNDDLEGKTITEEGTTVTINFRQAAQYNYTVNAVDADENILSTIIENGINFEGDQLVVRSPKYFANGGDLYIIGEDAAATNPTTKFTENLTSDETILIKYSIAESGNFYMYELNGGYTTRTDNESSGSAATGSANVTVPVNGVYIVTANCYGSAANRTATVKVGETTLVAATDLTIYAPGTNLVSTETFLNADDVITINTSDSKSGIDYVILQKTGDVQLKSSENLQGYKTFYNASKSFEVDANTTIYKVAAPDNGYVAITAVEGKIIPAGTPVFLKTSDTENYAITLAETAEETTGDFTGNALQAATTDGTIAGAYILAYTTADGLGIYKYTGSLNVGDVYLAAAGQGAKLRFGFADDATAIKTIAVDATDNSAIYNLSGQRVNAAYKGIVIKNGQKYIAR